MEISKRNNKPTSKTTKTTSTASVAQPDRSASFSNAVIPTSALKNPTPKATTSSKSTATASNSNSKGKRTSKQDEKRTEALGIVNWLENTDNFQLITGSKAQHSKVLAGQKISKMDAYRKLAKIDTVERKLDILCPYYDRWDRLFGDRENITPSDISFPAVDSSDDDDGNGELEDAVIEQDGEEEVNQGEDQEELDEDEGEKAEEAENEEDILSAFGSVNRLDNDMDDDDMVNMSDPYVSLKDKKNQNKFSTKTPRRTHKRRASVASDTSSSLANDSSAPSTIKRKKARNEDGFSTILAEAANERTKLEEQLRREEMSLQRQNLDRQLDLDERKFNFDERKFNFDERKFNFEKEQLERELAYKEKQLQSQIDLERSKVKASLLQSLIASGKSPDEISKYMEII
ncbi:hypothetical protein HDV05_006235 [Chytridiales sp. JEL 0842]|nr:hypothetical protein HDV05_006235 [Chytridiales sp. JEL 0842]